MKGINLDNVQIWLIWAEGYQKEMIQCCIQTRNDSDQSLWPPKTMSPKIDQERKSSLINF